MANEVFGAVLSMKDNVSAVLKQAKDSTSSYRKEIDKAKQEVAKLQKEKLAAKEMRLKSTQAYQEIEKVKKKLEPIGKKVIELKAKTEMAQEKIKGVKEKLSQIKDKVVNIAVSGAEKATKALGTAALIGTTAAFAAAGAAGTYAVSSAVQFQAQMQNVGTLLDGDVNAKLDSMKTQLKDVSLETGVATSDLTNGLYQTISAFGESADSVKQLEVAAKSAKAGNATTADSINLLSAVTKGYGDTSAEAVTKASDLAFETAKLGQTTFPELASSIGAVVPLASTLKISQEELFGAMATLTGVTGSTSEVTTQLKATLQSFLSPSESMGEALKGIGYASGAAALESDDLGTVLQKLKDSVGGDEVAFANLFSSTEAITAALALSGSQADAFSQKTEAMKTAAGASEKAFNTQTDSVQAMVSKVKNAGSVMLSSIGEKTLPYITSALQTVIDKLPAMESAFDAVAQNVAPVIQSVGGVLSDLWAQWQPIMSQIGESFGAAFDQCAPAVSGMMASFSGIVSAVQPVIASFLGGITSILPVVTTIFSGIAGVASTVFPIVSQIVSEVGSKVQAAFSMIGEHTGFLQDIFAVVGPAISTVLETLWNVAGPIVDLACAGIDLVIAGIDLVLSAVESAFPYIQSVIQGVWNIIKPICDGIGSLVDFISGAVSKVAGALTSATSMGGSPQGQTGGTSAGNTSGSGVAAHATGTNYYSGGWTTVGEHGTELMKLPAGTEIKSNSETKNIAGSSSGGVNVVVQKMEVRSESDIHKVAKELADLVDDARDNM